MNYNPSQGDIYNAEAGDPFHIGEKYFCLFGDQRHTALFGGRGSGKSHAVGTVLPILAAKKTHRIVCARQFQNSIRDSSKELIENKIRAMGLSNQFHITEREIVHKEKESRFTFIGLDRNPESAKSLEGATILWVEEARTINSTSMEMIIPTIRMKGSHLIWTWNPEHKTDPVDEYFRGPVQPPDSVVLQCYIEDNPHFYTGTALANEMWHMQNGNEKRYRHVWLGEYDEDFEGKIFSNVTIGRVEVPDHIPPRYGADWGFGNDPSTLVKLYVNMASREIYIAREAYGRVPLRQLPEMFDEVVDSRDDLIMGDSSQPGTIDHLNSVGFNVVGAKKGPGSVKSGINWLQGFKIIIDPACEKAREEFNLYSWMKDKITKKRLSTPVDAHNHIIDGIRYACESSMVEGEEENEDGGVIKLNFGRRRR